MASGAPSQAAEQRGLPVGFTVYPGAELVSDDPIETKAGSGQIITMTTRASPVEVAQFYQRQAERAGIPIGSSTRTEGMMVLGGARPDGARFDLTAAQMGDGGTSANLMVIDGPQG